MKKLLLLFTLTVLPLVAWCADGDTFTANTVEGVAMTFKVTSEANKQCQVGDGSGSPAVNSSTAGAITIPSEVNGYSVTSIGNYAFYNCNCMTSVTIPNSVTSIGEHAFKGCRSLTFVAIPNSVTSIRNYAFSGCSGLTSVTISNSVTSIGSRAFYDCRGLTSISIPNSVTSIEDGAFGYCSGLTSITIPNSVTSIGPQAFRGCSGLTSITIPNSMMSIGQGAFWCGISLTSVHISDIAAWCNINFEDIPLFYAHHLYLNGEEIKDLVIPNSVTSIGNNVFSYCSGLNSVTIPNSVTSIGVEAFRGCSGLTSVTIPNSVTSIGDWAFSSCSGLPSVTIPNSVTCIGNYAFYGCSGLAEVHSQIARPFAINSGVFSDIPADATLYVPAGTKETYKKTDGWNNFTNIVEDGPVAVTSVTLNKTKMSLRVGSTTKLKVTVLPANADNKNVTWSTSNNTVATVEANGTVKGIKEGVATITCASVEDPSIFAKCTINVRTVASVIEGDLNDDGEVDVTDVVELIDMVLAGIYDKAGDINEDGEVDVTDVVELIDMVLSGE